MLVTRVPVRTADLGGWTDTWFAKTGLVYNVAVEPGIEVRIRDAGIPHGFVALRAAGDRVVGHPSDWSAWPDALLAACLSHAPSGTEVEIRTGVPKGSGLGTSAAITVALLGAFDCWRGQEFDERTLVDLAQRAHAVETGLGRQSGVQDHFAAALGGVRLWDITYPQARTVHSLTDQAILSLLDDRLVTVYLGTPHESSAIHERVIRELERLDERSSRELLQPLREAARRGSDALAEGDFVAYGQAMVANHEAQRRLSGELISDLADHVVLLAALQGVVGWKVNGAGGDGGSLTLLLAKGQSVDGIKAALCGIENIKVLPLRVARLGLRCEWFATELDDNAL